MKFLLVAAAFTTALVHGQVAPVVPGEMLPLKMLQGEWHTAGGWVDYRFNSAGTKMTVRTRPDKGFSAGREMMTIFLQGGKVYADFTDTTGEIIRYRLVESAARKLVFADSPTSGKPMHRMIYLASPSSGEMSYRLLTGSKTTDSGVLSRNVVIRPLSE
jgi:hypothetical protein